MVDAASGHIWVELQQGLNTHQTLKAKENYEEMCREQGVIPQQYVSDAGPAFASAEFS